MTLIQQPLRKITIQTSNRISLSTRLRRGTQIWLMISKNARMVRVFFFKHRHGSNAILRKVEESVIQLEWPRKPTMRWKNTHITIPDQIAQRLRRWIQYASVLPDSRTIFVRLKSQRCVMYRLLIRIWLMVARTKTVSTTCTKSKVSIPVSTLISRSLSMSYSTSLTVRQWTHRDLSWEADIRRRWASITQMSLTMAHRGHRSLTTLQRTKKRGSN